MIISMAWGRGPRCRCEFHNPIIVRASLIVSPITKGRLRRCRCLDGGRSEMAKRIWQERAGRRMSLLAVRIRGCDTRGNSVSQVACTLNVSRGGDPGLSELSGAESWKHCLACGITREEGRFKVVWTRKEGKTTQWQAGLRCLEAADKSGAVEMGCGLDPEDSLAVC